MLLDIVQVLIKDRYNKTPMAIIACYNYPFSVDPNINIITGESCSNGGPNIGKMVVMFCSKYTDLCTKYYLNITPYFPIQIK